MSENKALEKRLEEADAKVRLNKAKRAVDKLKDTVDSAETRFFGAEGLGGIGEAIAGPPPNVLTTDAGAEYKPAPGEIGAKTDDGLIVLDPETEESAKDLEMKLKEGKALGGPETSDSASVEPKINKVPDLMKNHSSIKKGPGSSPEKMQEYLTGISTAVSGALEAFIDDEKGNFTGGFIRRFFTEPDKQLPDYVDAKVSELGLKLQGDTADNVKYVAQAIYEAFVKPKDRTERKAYRRISSEDIKAKAQLAVRSEFFDRIAEQRLPEVNTLIYTLEDDLKPIVENASAKKDAQDEQQRRNKLKLAALLIGAGAVGIIGGSMVATRNYCANDSVPAPAAAVYVMNDWQPSDRSCHELSCYDDGILPALPELPAVLQDFVNFDFDSSVPLTRVQVEEFEDYVTELVIENEAESTGFAQPLCLIADGFASIEDLEDGDAPELDYSQHNMELSQDRANALAGVVERLAEDMVADVNVVATGWGETDSFGDELEPNRRAIIGVGDSYECSASDTPEDDVVFSDGAEAAPSVAQDILDRLQPRSTGIDFDRLFTVDEVFGEEGMAADGDNADESVTAPEIIGTPLIERSVVPDAGGAPDAQEFINRTEAMIIADEVYPAVKQAVAARAREAAATNDIAPEPTGDAITEAEETARYVRAMDSRLQKIISDNGYLASNAEVHGRWEVGEVYRGDALKARASESGLGLVWQRLMEDYRVIDSKLGRSREHPYVKGVMDEARDKLVEARGALDRRSEIPAETGRVAAEAVVYLEAVNAIVSECVNGEGNSLCEDVLSTSISCGTDATGEESPRIPYESGDTTVCGDAFTEATAMREYLPEDLELQAGQDPANAPILRALKASVEANFPPPVPENHGQGEVGSMTDDIVESVDSVISHDEKGSKDTDSSPSRAQDLSAAIYDAYHTSGKSMNDIADEFGISRYAAGKAVRAHEANAGLAHHRRSLAALRSHDALVGEAYSMFCRGESFAGIGRKIGRSASTARRYVDGVCSLI